MPCAGGCVEGSRGGLCPSPKVTRCGTYKASLLRLNTTIAVKFRRVVGVEAPAMFRRRRHGGRLLGFTVARIRGDSGVVIAADNGTDSAVVAAEM